MMAFLRICLISALLIWDIGDGLNLPLVINTWAFTNATTKAWNVIAKEAGSALDAVEKGCSQCEIDQCDFTVGYGGSPDENGETTLDAMIMHGDTHHVGAVGALRYVKNAISVARRVLEHTQHTLLVGDQATQFALTMGFKEENLATDYSLNLWRQWEMNKCQPNFWRQVTPDPSSSCGPYKTSPSKNKRRTTKKFGVDYHDSIGMIVIDGNGKIAGGTSSNGEEYKIPGRVGDAPIVGAGLYVDRDVGGASATGDGDAMMALVPSYHTVENMRRGMNPTEAAQDAVMRIVAKDKYFTGAIIATKINGEYGAACHGMESFPFSVANPKFGTAKVLSVSCMKGLQQWKK